MPYKSPTRVTALRLMPMLIYILCILETPRSRSFTRAKFNDETSHRGIKHTKQCQTIIIYNLKKQRRQNLDQTILKFLHSLISLFISLNLESVYFYFHWQLLFFFFFNHVYESGLVTSAVDWRGSRAGSVQRWNVLVIQSWEFLAENWLSNQNWVV